MMSSTILRGAFAALAVVALAACGDGGGTQSPAGTTSEHIAVDGSSTVFPLAEAAAEAFTNTQTAAARVTVGESGTGGGFGKFCLQHGTEAKVHAFKVAIRIHRQADAGL